MRLIALMMEAARTSETLVTFYRTTRRYNPEDGHLRTHHRENLRFYLMESLITGLCARQSLWLQATLQVTLVDSEVAFS
jgi:hypothetical protein